MLSAKWVIVLGLIAVGVFFVDRLLLWFESRGWIYYRRIKPKSGGSSSFILSGLNAVFHPQAQYVIKAKKESKVEKKQKAGETTRPRIDPDE